PPRSTAPFSPVSDTGSALPPRMRGRSSRSSARWGRTAKKVEGAGLRLTLCRKFVEPHGGKIWVKSEVGVGSRLAFTLPHCIIGKVSLQATKVTEVACTRLTRQAHPG